ncbi:SPAG8 protein, partial [Baryphthengus martii]|nr:SPAG8 protein [Baryphthengus martii]
PAEEHSQLVPRESCLIHTRQEEKATNHLDAVPGKEPGTEALIHQHGHHRVSVHQLLSWPTNGSMTTKDTYCSPHRALILGRGEVESRPQAVCPPKRHREEMLEEVCPHQMPMESVSTTHQDYRVEGCQFTPLPTTQPHNYFTEQPSSFWLEQARSLPGVTSIDNGNSPFRRNAAFSTPITEYLGQPLQRIPLSSRFQPHKQ